MFELTHKQLELITADVNHADISYSHLKYDLIDHICCDLEQALDQGISFEKAYEEIKGKIGFHGLQQIQEDTLYLIDKKYRIMKNTMKTFGVIAPILLSVGALFKIQHWMGASIILTLGFFVLTFIFLPSAVYVSYSEISNRKKLFIHLTGFLAAFLFSISFLFKIQHWPWTNILLLAATIITGILFLPAFFFNLLNEKDNNQKSAFIFGLIGSIIYLAGFFCKIEQLPGAFLLLTTGAILLIFIALPLFIYLRYRNNAHLSSRFIFLSFTVIWFISTTSLINLNLTQNAQNGFILNTFSKNTNIQYLTTACKKLVETIDTSSNDMQRKQIAIIKQTNELVDYIQAVKIKILNRKIGHSISKEQTIDLKMINMVTIEDCQAVLFKEDELHKIKNKLDSLKELFIFQNTFDLTSYSILSELLSTPGDNKIVHDPTKWEYTFYRSPLPITTMNKLTYLQEKIRTSELFYLRKSQGYIVLNTSMDLIKNNVH